jgi:putative two-component system response regulator
MTRVLLAEDDDALRKMIRAILELDKYEVFSYPNGQLALESFEEVNPDLVVSDISMPILDGFGLLEAVRKLPTGSVVPFLFLSALSEHDDVFHAKRLGVDDYLFKPFQPDDLLVAVKARLERRRAAELFHSREAHLQTITLLANVIEARDALTRGHVERVQQLAIELGRALNWSLEDMIILEFGALLHDVGKITTPESVLNKPGQLTPEEIEIMRAHTTAGAHIMESVPHLRPAKSYVLSHHERWDGTGYPQGLMGEDIPREGRLMAIVDVYDAITSDRPYHAGISPKDALNFLRRGSGRHFDPHMVDSFYKIQLKKLEAMENETSGE